MLAKLRSLHATLARLEQEGASPARLADAAVTMWRQIETALSPIIGQRGVAALFRRSVFHRRAEYPWLVGPPDSTDQSDVLIALHAVLLLRTSSDATAAMGDLMHTFLDLLSGLIGGSLAERLLQSVPDNLSSGTAEQEETSP